MGQYMVSGLFRGLLPKLPDQLRGVHSARHTDEVLHGIAVQISFSALELGDDLVNLKGNLRFLFLSFKAIQQLTKRNRWIDRHWFHGIDRVQRLIDTNRIVNLKVCLVNFRAKTSRTAQHLLEQNTGFHPPQEHQIGDFRDINTSGQQIHRNNDAGIFFRF